MVGAGMMNGNIHFHDFTTKTDLVEKLAQSITQNLEEAIMQNNQASLIVSGGNTPKPLFEKLRQIDISWEKVTIGLCDERWVNPTHQESNEHLVKTYLLQDAAAKANFVGMYIKCMDPSSAQEQCHQHIKQTLYPFDVVILGMGTDAHTASLFPENSKLDEGFDMQNPSLCIAITPDTAPHMRMSLTLPAILSANHLYLHFEGKEKLNVYQEALQGKDMYTMPIRSILHQQQKDIEVYYA